MTDTVPATLPPEAIRVLTRGDVRASLSGIDPVAVVEDTLRKHARHETTLPNEAYMPWANSLDAYCRSLAMPGAIGTGTDTVLGLKVINAAVSNPATGLPRAGGFTTLFDYETGRPRLLAEGALVSALRTAAYTIASLRHLGPSEFDTVAFIGCGNLARVHAGLLLRYFPKVSHLKLLDTRTAAAEAVRDTWTSGGGRTASLHATVEETLAKTPVVITLTTSNEPYIDATWLDERAFVAHVSLDDVRTEAFTTAAGIYVDDLDLVADNPRRILGALLRDGVVIPDKKDTTTPVITGTLGDVLCGTAPAIRPDTGRVISNPFGMSILDLALMRRVSETAERDDRGLIVDLTLDLPADALTAVKKE